jgi:hypothetical protein
MMMGDPSVMAGELSYLMDQSRGKLLSERRSQEVTSSDPAPSRFLWAPELGTQRPGGGGAGIAWLSHVGPTHSL